MKRNLLIRLLLGLAFTSPLLCFGQISISVSKPSAESAKPTSRKMSFDAFCEKNAIQLMDVGNDKFSELKISGTLNYIDIKKNPGLKSYGLTPAENETTYYKLNGSDKILAVKSLYVLKLMYANSKD